MNSKTLNQNYQILSKSLLTAPPNKHGRSGLGAIVYHPDLEHSASIPLGTGTNNTAELEAIHTALEIICRDHVSLHTRSLPIHIFTDSKYARETLLDFSPRKKNFYVIEDTKNLCRKLHIEKTIFGIRYIEGNREADELASSACRMSDDNDVLNQTANVFTKMQSCITRLLKEIEEKLAPDEEAMPTLDGPSSQGDDFDAQVDASQELTSSCDT